MTSFRFIRFHLLSCRCWRLLLQPLFSRRNLPGPGKRLQVPLPPTVDGEDVSNRRQRMRQQALRQRQLLSEPDWRVLLRVPPWLDGAKLWHQWVESCSCWVGHLYNSWLCFRNNFHSVSPCWIYSCNMKAMKLWCLCSVNSPAVWLIVCVCVVIRTGSKQSEFEFHLAADWIAQYCCCALFTFLPILHSCSPSFALYSHNIVVRIKCKAPGTRNIKQRLVSWDKLFSRVAEN